MRIAPAIFVPVCLILAYGLHKKVPTPPTGFGTLGITGSLRDLKIHESFLKPLADLATLDSSRIKIVNSMVELKGPVLIVASSRNMLILKIALTVLCASWTGAFVSAWAPRKTRRGEKAPLVNTVGVLAGVAFGFLAWNTLSKTIPATAGIFFYNSRFV